MRGTKQFGRATRAASALAAGLGILLAGGPAHDSLAHAWRLADDAAATAPEDSTGSVVGSNVAVEVDPPVAEPPIDPEGAIVDPAADGSAPADSVPPGASSDLVAAEGEPPVLASDSPTLPQVPSGIATPTEDAAATAPSAPTERQPLGRDAGLFSLGGNEGEGPDAPAAAGGSILDRFGGVPRVVGSLAVVVGLLLLLASLAKRFGRPLGSAGRPAGVVDVLARYPLGRGQHLALVRVGRQVLILHQTRATMTSLAVVDDPDDVAALVGQCAGRGSAGTRRREHFQDLLNREDRAYARGLASPASSGSVETVDLTRSRGLLASLARRKSAA